MVLKAGGGMLASMLTGFAVGAGTGAASGAAGSAIYQGITTGQVNKEQVKLAAISTGAGLAAAGAAAPALGAGNKAVSKVLGKALQRFGMGESAAAAAATVTSMAGEGTLLGGTMAGVGDIAAQGYNIHAGNQTSINWKQTAKSTLVGGAAGFVTGGAIGMFSLTSAGQSFGKWMSEPTKLDLKAAEMVKSFWGDNRGSVGFGAKAGGSSIKSFADMMSPEEAARYKAYFIKNAPDMVVPGTKELEGIHLHYNSLTGVEEVQPWKAYYDDYGRLMARTDYTAGNKTAGIPAIHHHLFEWGKRFANWKNPHEYESHLEGEFR